MPLILNIDTALDTAFVFLAEDGEVMHSSINENQTDHATWLHGAIDSLIKKAGVKAPDLRAVGISNGPGSYTGLRIGLSAAKGLCYSLKIPLITITTLEVIAFDAIRKLETPGARQTISDSGPGTGDILFCPMIDARRMEVFTALYDSNLGEITKPSAMILNETSFEELLKRQKILFLGNGSIKFQKLCRNPNATFTSSALDPAALATLTYRNFIGNNFANLAYTEPLYVKEFFNGRISKTG